MDKPKLFRRDFTMVVIGQIISLFGNGILRFALPLYLLNQTQSAVLFGVVSACSFIPMIILAPIGGIFADRVNKRNIMVALDFSTAGLMLLFTFLLGNVDVVVLIVTTLIILFGIQGAYSPSVQASIPALAAPELLVPANSVVTLVNSLASLIGPVIGGAIYGIFGIYPILIVSIGCFFASAIMEIFIHIPFEKKKFEGSVFSVAKNDIKESVRFIRTEQPVIMKIGFYVAAINLIFSALLIIGLPIIITQKLGFEEQLGNQLLGYCQGALAAGGLLGGILSSVISRKIGIKKCHYFLFLCAFLLLPIGVSLMLSQASMVSYIIIVVCCFFSMLSSTVFSIEMMSYIQLITPKDLIGKIMAIAMCLCMCASPLGQAVYGWLFEVSGSSMFIIFYAAAALSAVVALISRSSFKKLKSEFEQ